MILTNYAIKFRTAVFVLIVVILIAGIYSYMNLPREGPPDITIPFVYVTAVYEGTAPQEMEKLIAIPIEKKLNELDGVKEITSTSDDSVASISVEFLAGAEIDLAMQRVKNKVDLARPDLPDDLEEPTVESLNFSSDIPIYTFAISGDPKLPRLKHIAEDLQDRLEDLPGVKEAEIAGAREREIRVEPDLELLAAYNIPVGLLMQRIQQENSTISAGNIEFGGSKFQLRIPGEFDDVIGMKDIMLVERNGDPTYLTDVARVVDTHKDIESISRINGEPCVSLAIKKRSGGNTVGIIERVEKELEAFPFPPDIKLTIVNNQSDYIDDLIKELENNIFTGFLLVVIVLFLFMGQRNSLFVAIAIPVSMLIAFMVLPLMGLTLNMMVLFSLLLAVGMLVDNAIVIVENIFRHHNGGLSKVDAARRGGSEVAWPIITSTLTTLCAFSPLLFWPDVMGQFMSIMPRSLIVVLSASLFVAIVINPAVCSTLISRQKPRRESGFGRVRAGFLGGYEKLLRMALEYRVAVLLLAIAFMIFTLFAYGYSENGSELFPKVQPRNAIINVTFPQGTSIERTDALLASFEKKLPKYEDVKFYLSNVGVSGVSGFGQQVAGTHVGHIWVEFLEYNKRRGNTFDIVERLRAEIGSVPGADVKVERQREGPPLPAPITIELSGDDFDELAGLAREIETAIATVPGLVDLQNDLEDSLPEVQFRLDRKRAAMLGMDTRTVGTFLRAAVYGLETSKFRAGEDEYDITVRMRESDRDDLGMLERVYMPRPAGSPVPLSSLGKSVYAGGRGAIKRKNRERVVTLTGSNEGRDVKDIIDDVSARIARIDMPPGYKVHYAGDTEEMEKSTEFLSSAFIVALGLILVILVIQFNSVLLPVVIVFSVLLSMIGVMWGLLICGMRFSVIMTGLGIISLAGIVVNNSIVLVSTIVQRRNEGMSKIEAVVDAGCTRLRPVLLTATTTILGLIPMAVGYSIEIHQWPPSFIAGAESSAWWAPMAVAVIFGLAFATLLTLVMVPVMYSLVDSFADIFRKRFLPSED